MALQSAGQDGDGPKRPAELVRSLKADRRADRNHTQTESPGGKPGAFCFLEDLDPKAYVDDASSLRIYAPFLGSYNTISQLTSETGSEGFEIETSLPTLAPGVTGIGLARP